jgi:hypothetical protein
MVGEVLLMPITLRLRATVQPGHRLEVVAPELPEGETVEVLVQFSPPPAPARGGILDFLDALPPGPRSAASWEEVDRQFHQERDAWDR